MTTTATQNNNASIGFRNIKIYGEILFLALFLMHAVAFFAFQWFELRELRLELSDIAQSIALAPDQFVAPQKGVIAQYPNGVIVLQKIDREVRNGFHEMNISGRDYLVYTDNNNIMVAKPEHDVREEILKFLSVLVALYCGEVIVLLGWWFYLKDQIKELFSVH